MRPGAVLLRAVEGEAEEPLLVFQAGFAVGPFSLGLNGDWKVRAAEVASLHVFLWFDGRTLYAAKSQGAPEVWANDQELEEDWSVLSDGTELRLGAARISVSADHGLRNADATATGLQSEARDATSQSYRATTLVKTSQNGDGSSALLVRLGLMRGRGPTLRGLLLLSSLPAGLLLWLALMRAPSAERRAVPAPTHPGSESAKPQPSSARPDAGPEPSRARQPGALSALEANRVPRATTIVSPASRRSLERRAADAVLRGEFDSARNLYAELSGLEPGSSTFSAAKKIAARNADREGARNPNTDDEH